MNTILIVLIFITILCSSSSIGCLGYFFYSQETESTTTPSTKTTTPATKTITPATKTTTSATPATPATPSTSATSSTPATPTTPTTPTTPATPTTSATPATPATPVPSWFCLPGINVPLRKGSSGDIECMSLNNTDCLWKSSKEECSSLISEYTDKESDIKPLVCGSMHQEKHGGTGYSNSIHWCSKGKIFLDSFSNNKEVYGTIGYNYTKDQAESACQNLGAKLATLDELQVSQLAGADWCSTGWLKNENEAMYPITTTTGQGCGNGSAGIKTWTPPERVAAVNCIGVKPPQGTPGIHPFSGSKWSIYN